MSTIKYYHYTSGIALEKILKNKKILQATASVRKKEKPCAWVSTNANWENTATKLSRTNVGLRQLTFEQQLVTVGCARIEVKSNNLYPWRKLKHLTRINAIEANRLEEAGIAIGANPMEWFGSLYPIGIDQWVKIEVCKNGEWIEYEELKQN
jgi:hypothetical protein